MKLSYAIDKYGTLNEKKTVEDYHDTGNLLENYKYFKMEQRQTLIGEFLCP